MKAEELEKWILENYSSVVVADAYRERSFFYNPNAYLPKGIYFATIKESDGPNDRASQLDRDGVYRLSMGVGKSHYQSLFGAVPQRPTKGQTVEIDLIFSTLETLMPHPIYAWMAWVCINSPGTVQISLLRELLDISYELALAKFALKV